MDPPPKNFFWTAFKKKGGPRKNRKKKSIGATICIGRDLVSPYAGFFVVKDHIEVHKNTLLVQKLGLFLLMVWIFPLYVVALE